MGRESCVACMPTWSCSMSGGSCAPMENSPPGINTMPGWALPGESVLLGTVGAKDTPADIVRGAGSAEGAAIELTGDGVGTTAATVRLGASLQRVMPMIAMTDRVTSVQGGSLCVGLAAFLTLLAFRIKILRSTTAERLRNHPAGNLPGFSSNVSNDFLVLSLPYLCLFLELTEPSTFRICPHCGRYNCRGAILVVRLRGRRRGNEPRE